MTQPTSTAVQTEADGPFHPHMTRRQAKFAVDLINKTTVEGSADREGYKARYFRVSSHSMASALIQDLKSRPEVAPSLTAPQGKGTFRQPLTGQIFRVVESKGKLYASKLVEIGGTRLTELGEFVNVEWQQAKLGQIDAAWKISDEDAKAFALRYGRCSECHRQLKDATSVSLGTGPDCGGRR